MCTHTLWKDSPQLINTSITSHIYLLFIIGENIEVLSALSKFQLYNTVVINYSHHVILLSLTPYPSHNWKPVLCFLWSREGIVGLISKGLFPISATGISPYFFHWVWTEEIHPVDVHVSYTVRTIGKTREQKWDQWGNWHFWEKQHLHKENITWNQRNGKGKEVKKPNSVSTMQEKLSCSKAKWTKSEGMQEVPARNGRVITMTELAGQGVVKRCHV